MNGGLKNESCNWEGSWPIAPPRRVDHVVIAERLKKSWFWSRLFREGVSHEISERSEADLPVFPTRPRSSQAHCSSQRPSRSVFQRVVGFGSSFESLSGRVTTSAPLENSFSRDNIPSDRRMKGLNRLLSAGSNIFHLLLVRAGWLVRRLPFWVSTRKLRNIMLFRCDSIGDMVIFAPTLQEYRRLFPAAKITVVASSTSEELLRTNSHFDDLQLIDYELFKRSVVERIRWWMKVQRVRYDIAINTMYSSGFPQSDAVIGYTGARRRIGFAEPSRFESGWRRRCYSEFVYALPMRTFEGNRHNSLLRYLGSIQYRWAPNLVPQGISAGSRNLELPQGGFGVLFPGAQSSVRRSAVASFVIVATEVSRSMDWSWIVSGTVNENSVCSEVASGLQANGVRA